jgi:hypothetical protein
MKQVQVVAPEYVCQLWPSIEKFLERSLWNSPDDCTLDQLKTILIRGTQVLFIAIEDKEISGAMAVEIVSYPNTRVAQITALGGRSLLAPYMIEQFESWAKMQGCTKVRAWAKDSQTRLYKMKMGLEKTMNVVEKDL